MRHAASSPSFGSTLFVPPDESAAAALPFLEQSRSGEQPFVARRVFSKLAGSTFGAAVWTETAIVAHAGLAAPAPCVEVVADPQYDLLWSATVDGHVSALHAQDFYPY
jgi:hypothetical protein